MRRACLLLLAVTAACGGEIHQPAVIDLQPPSPGQPLQVAADPPGLRCIGGEPISAGGRTYCIQKKATTFRESERWCAANGGHLATIGSDVEGRELKRALGSPIGFDYSAWIGLIKMQTQGVWMWSTGHDVGPERWAPGEPNNAGGNEGCGEIYAGAAVWNDNVCSNGRPYFCEGRAGPLRCTGVSFRAGSIAYCFERAEVSWLEAEQRCVALGGNLASFGTTQEMDQFTAAIASRLGSDRAWIGYTDEGHEGRWTTVTGRAPGYTSWRAGEPNNAGGNENCAEWYAADAGWNDIPCDEAHVGICAPR